MTDSSGTAQPARTHTAEARAAAQRISIIHFHFLFHSFWLCHGDDGMRAAVATGDYIWFDARQRKRIICVLLVKSQTMTTRVYITNYNLYTTVPIEHHLINVYAMCITSRPSAPLDSCVCGRALSSQTTEPIIIITTKYMWRHSLLVAPKP